MAIRKEKTDEANEERIQRESNKVEVAIETKKKKEQFTARWNGISSPPVVC